MELPRVQAIVFHHALELCAAGGQHDFRRAVRRQRLAVEVRDVQEVDAVDDDTLFGCRLAFQHAGAVHGTRVLLDDRVARARRQVVAIRPDGRTRIVREEGPVELVAVILAERIARRAHGVAHRVRALRLRPPTAARATSSSPTSARRRRGRGRGRDELGRSARLAGSAGTARRCRLAGFRLRHRLVKVRPAAEQGHHNQPAIGELVVTHDGISVVARVALAAESVEHRVGGHGAIEDAAGRVVFGALLREDGQPAVHDLNNMVWPDRQTVVRGVSTRRWALGAVEPDPEPVEAGRQRHGGFLARRTLLDRSRAVGGRDDWRDDGLIAPALPRLTFFWRQSAPTELLRAVQAGGSGVRRSVQIREWARFIVCRSRTNLHPWPCLRRGFGVPRPSRFLADRPRRQAGNPDNRQSRKNPRRLCHAGHSSRGASARQVGWR